MKFNVNFKNLYDARVKHLYYGGTIDPFSYDLISKLGGVIIPNGEEVEAKLSSAVNGMVLCYYGKFHDGKIIHLTEREFKLLTGKSLEEI